MSAVMSIEPGHAVCPVFSGAVAQLNEAPHAAISARSADKLRRQGLVGGAADALFKGSRFRYAVGVGRKKYGVTRVDSINIPKLGIRLDDTMDLGL